MKAANLPKNVQKAWLKIERRATTQHKLLLQRMESFKPAQCKEEPKVDSIANWVQKEVAFAKDVFDTLVPITVSANDDAFENWFQAISKMSPIKLELRPEEDEEDAYDDDGYMLDLEDIEGVNDVR